MEEQAKLVEKQQKLMEKQEKFTATLAVPRISNTAAQVLNHAAGQAFRSTRCRKFAALGPANASIVQLSKATSTPADSLVRNLDFVIVRRNNNHTHFTSTAALEAEVVLCLDLLAANPALRQQCQWESWVLENFNHIKTAFHPMLS